MIFKQISITLPAEVLKGTDARARELDRPRSWVIAEALRRFLASPRVSEPAAVAYATRRGLGEYRTSQLEADLVLTPEQRVLEADRTARDAEKIRGRRRSAGTLLAFDRYEDYLDWQRRDAVE